MDSTEAITIPQPPTPRDPRTLQRWAHTRVRRRLLYGEWRQDLEERLQVEVGTTRSSAWGLPDLSSNVFSGACKQLAVLYDRPPTIRAPAGGEELVAEVERSGWWVLAQRVQRDTLGLREMLVHIDVVDGEDGPELQYRPVFPDMVEAEALPDRPEEPVHLFEAVLRTTADGERIWTWDEWDIREIGTPVFRVWDADRTTELSDTFELGGLVGEGYTWRTEDARPILPFAMYHASKTGCLFDAFECRELVEGALNIGVLWTFFKHVSRNCSFPQRYIAGGKLSGVQTSDDPDDTSDRREVIADPAVVLEFTADEPGGQMQIGAFPVAADPAVIQEATALYERRVAATGGISPADVQRVAGDPRSGYALAITTEGQRAAARRFEPLFRRADERLLRISALLWAAATQAKIPTAGYRVSYAAIPPSPDEQKAERDHLLALLDRGLITKAEVYQRLNPGTTEEDADLALAAIAEKDGANRPAPPAPGVSA